jgi:hypothetical protein
VVDSPPAPNKQRKRSAWRTSTNHKCLWNTHRGRGPRHFSSFTSRRLQAKLLWHHHVLCTKMALPKRQQKKTPTKLSNQRPQINTPIDRAKHPSMQLGYMVCHYYTGVWITSKCRGLNHEQLWEIVASQNWDVSYRPQHKLYRPWGKPSGLGSASASTFFYPQCKCRYMNVA